MIVHVKGGTDAGKRTIWHPEAWECRCGVNPGYRYSCPDCGARRP